VKLLRPGALALPCGVALAATAALDGASYMAFVSWLAGSLPVPEVPVREAIARIGQSAPWAASTGAGLLGLLLSIRALARRSGASRWIAPGLVALAVIGHAALLASIFGQIVIGETRVTGCTDGVVIWREAQFWEASVLLRSAGVLIGAGGVLAAARAIARGRRESGADAVALAAIFALAGGALLAFVARAAPLEYGPGYSLKVNAALRASALEGIRWVEHAIWATAAMWGVSRLARSKACGRADLGLLALGIAGLIATRPLAHDAFGPLPIVEYTVFNAVKSAPPRPARPCDPQGFNPTLIVTEDGEATLDGRVIQTEAEASERLQEIRRQLEDLHSLAQDDSRPRPEVDLLAPAALRMTALQPLLRGALTAGFHRVNALSVVTHVVDSATAGRLEFHERCALHVELSESGERFNTWSDVARAAAVRSVSLQP